MVLKSERADIKNWCILARGIQAKRRVKSEVENKGYMYLCPKYVM